MLEILYIIDTICDWVLAIVGFLWLLILFVAIGIGIIKYLFIFCKWIYKNLAKFTQVIMKELK